MKVNCEYLDYQSTGNFSKLIIDYIQGNEQVKPFYLHAPDLRGILHSIENRKQFNTDRATLVNHLRQQYKSTELITKVEENIEALLDQNTFTVCTAHQPNIFTGHLYFVYKILHTIKLAAALKAERPQYNFIPVYYMGNEDADIEELGHIYINGTKYEWNTKQTGAVGKMLVDDVLISLINEFSGQITVLPFGKEIISILKNAYQRGVTIQEATLAMVNNLFGQFGLVILIPDSPLLKKSMLNIFEEDLLNNMPAKLVEQTNLQISLHYKSQAQPREINLFYMADQVRNRIINTGNKFIVENTDYSFTKDQILSELRDHPEKFSPNVILRGLYQETILPNLAFIGGGGELSYWMQLKALFENYRVPFPVLVLRNSFLIIDKKNTELKRKLNISVADLFKNENSLLNSIVNENSINNLSVEKERQNLVSIYGTLISRVESIDQTLSKHVAALQKRSVEKLDALEKKMLRAEKRKYADQQQQLQKLKSSLFPHNNLQERIENFIPFYARSGPEILDQLLNHSLTFEHKFAVLEQQ